uniref:Uncharacterized protein AlNc14C558G12151 n=1 Tax=Albugo laibachii Nc14 TaxID=890382 RepID=F0X158_9STRA|nr:conserved hypothetical protein [Albugo laibachii Nc14]|eukprot:CCA27514.1 conserved hypothetical protein [Albugo laibachii Nc14]
MTYKRVSKTNLEKREVIQWIEGTGGGIPTRSLKHFQAERGWKVSGTKIRYWWKNRVAITNSPELQIMFMRAKKEKVSRQWIQASERELAQAELDDEEFSASDKRLAHFMARYGLSLRRTTNLTVLN